MEIKWKAPRPDAKKLSQPEGASSYYLDAYASGDLELAERIWKEFGRAIQRDREIDRRNWASSWNWWPIGLSASLLASDARTRPALVPKLIRYCQRQLDRVQPHHDLWGLEILSRIYPWPVAAMALVYDWAKERNLDDAVAALTDLLTAHAYTLALVSLPDPYPESPVDSLYVCAPGMRSHQFEMGTQISFITACILNAGHVRGRRAALLAAANPRVRVHWSSRVAWAASHGYLPEADRKMLLEHVDTGAHAAAIVDKLRALGVKFRTPVQVWRYKNGDYLAMAKQNVQSSTPPIMAMSRVDGHYHFLSVHPPGMRGHGGRRLGHPSKCWREGDRARVYFERAILSPNAEPQTLERSIPAPPQDGGADFHYAVRIGPRGAERLDAERRSQGILKLAREAADLAKGKPSTGIYQHAQVLLKILNDHQGDLEMIYRRARAIERLVPARADQDRIRQLAGGIVNLYEWWA